MKKPEITLKDNLRQLLNEKNMTLSQVCRYTNINKSTLHNYLNGIYPQGLLTTVKLAQFFNLQLEELVLGRSVEDLKNRFHISEGQYEITVTKIK